MSNQVDGREMPLARAALRLGLRHQQAYNAVLSGRLEGRQLDNGRYIVTVASVEEYERERQSLAAVGTGHVA